MVCVDKSFFHRAHWVRFDVTSHTVTTHTVEIMASNNARSLEFHLFTFLLCCVLMIEWKKRLYNRNSWSLRGPLIYEVCLKKNVIFFITMHIL